MKIGITILLLVSMFAGMFTGCSADNADLPKDTSGENQTNSLNTEPGDENSTSTDASTEGEILPEKTLNFGAWTDVGNDPCNIWQSEYTLAFDENYIYYNSGKREISRVKYDGTGAEVIYTKAAGNFMNVYNGALYFASYSGGGSNPFAKIIELDLATLEAKELMNMELNSWDDIAVKSMLAANGYVFTAVYTKTGSGPSCVTLLAINLETGLSTTINFTEKTDTAEFTVDNEGNLYAFVKLDTSTASTRRVLKIAIDEIGENTYLPMNEIVAEIGFYTHAGTVLAPNGIVSCSLETGLRYWDGVREDEKAWYYAPENYFVDVDRENPMGTLLSGRNQRFVIGDSMVIFATDPMNTEKDILGENFEEETKIYICYDFDFAKPQEILTAKGITLYINDENNRFGVYNDKLFIIEHNEDGTYKLLTISPDGTHTTNQISA